MILFGNFAELTRRSFSAITKTLEISVAGAKKPVAFFLGEFLCLLDVFLPEFNTKLPEK